MANFGSVTLTGYKECMDLFDPTRIKKVANRACFRTAKTVRTRASSKIREGYNIKKSDLDSNIKVYRESNGATIRVSGKNLNAAMYGTVTWNRKMPGAMVRIKKGSGKTIPHSFVIQRFGGKVFIRQGKSRLPIKPIVGPSARQLFGDSVIATVITKTIEDVAQKNFDSQLKFATGCDVDLGGESGE